MVEKQLNDEFLTLCRERNFEKLKEIYDENKITDETLKIGFNNVCLDNHADIDDDSHDIRSYNIEIAKWIYTLKEVDLDDIFPTSFYNKDDIVPKLIYSLKNINVQSKNKAFEIVCKKNNIELAKWVYSLGDINIHNNNDYIFNISNNLELIKWLLSLDEFSEDSLNNKLIESVENDEFELFEFLEKKCKTRGNKLFLIACKSASINFIKYLYVGDRVKLDKTNIRNNNSEEGINFFYEAFNNLINNRYLKQNSNEFIKEIYEIISIKLYFENERLFIHFCKNKNNELAKWIYNKGNVNINTNNNIAFMLCIKDKNSELAKWIYDDNEMIIKIDNNFHKDIFDNFIRKEDIHRSGLHKNCTRIFRNIMLDIIEIFRSKKTYNKIRFIDNKNKNFHMIRDIYNGLTNYIIELICKYWNDEINRYNRNNITENIIETVIRNNRSINWILKDINDNEPEIKYQVMLDNSLNNRRNTNEFNKINNEYEDISQEKSLPKKKLSRKSNII